LFLSDYISGGLLKFERVDTKHQIADIGTAPRPLVFRNGLALSVD
jgi:hypothetical protein